MSNAIPMARLRAPNSKLAYFAAVDARSTPAVLFWKSALWLR
jgi:hypothetical protein